MKERDAAPAGSREKKCCAAPVGSCLKLRALFRDKHLVCRNEMAAGLKRFHGIFKGRLRSADRFRDSLNGRIFKDLIRIICLRTAVRLALSDQNGALLKRFCFAQHRIYSGSDSPEAQYCCDHDPLRKKFCVRI